MSFPRIHTELAEKHQLVISERHVPNLFRLYLALVDCRTARDEVVQARLREQGKLILSGDAVRFDDVSPAVYVVREVLSGEILVAARLKQASEDALAEMLGPIRDLGIPVVGTICDKEKALLGAFETVFPEARHQICQTHYLINLVKPMASDLATLGAAVKDTTRKVSEIAKTLDRARVASPEERELAEMVCQAVAAMGKSHAGDKLFEPAALKRHTRLTELANETERAVKQKGGTWPLLERLLALLAALSGCGELARRLERQFQVVRTVAHILNAEATSSTKVAKRLQAYLDRLLAEAPQRGRGAARGRFHEHVVDVSQRFWKGLFHCYDVAELPRTNNALEQFFNALKQQARRIHGRKSTAGGPMESFAPYLLELWNRLEEVPSLDELVQGLSPENLARARSELKQEEEPARRRRSLLRAPQAHLNRALKNFLES